MSDQSKPNVKTGAATANMKNLMIQMSMRGMLDQVDETLMTANRESWGYTEMLDRLLQLEFDDRERKKRQRRIKAAKFRQTSRLEEVDTSAKRSLTKVQLKEIWELEWLKNARPLLLIGQTGVGKTYLGEAIGVHACENGFSTFLEGLVNF
jgi:DNA replication protein DnaC